MKWCRLYYEFAHDPKIQIMSETLQRRFVMLMCIQTEGLLPGLSDREVGHVMGLSPKKLNETKQVFLERNLIKNDWTLKNFEKRQFLSDDVTERVRKHRTNKINDNGKNETLQKRCCNVTVTASDTDTDTDTDIRPPIIPPTGGDRPFADFWEIYPRRPNGNRGSKAISMKRWRKLSRADQDAAIASIPVFMKTDKWRDGYNNEAQVFLNQRQWDDLPVIGKPCSTCNGKGWYYREWSDDATGRSMKRQKQPCDKCEARTNEPIDYDTVELIT